MEFPHAVSLRKFQEFNASQKDELYDTLVNLAEAVEEIPKKSLRKTLELTLAVLQYKGQQITDLQERLSLESQDTTPVESKRERLLAENEKLKEMVERSEDEKEQLKQKNRELTDEIFQLQKRLQDAANSADGSDKDSSDPLSELDKQEQLLQNINTKNKHIKRLLKEIESLQNQNIEQTRTIMDAKKELQAAKEEIIQLNANISLVENERKLLKESSNELTIELKRLEGNITYLEEEREKSEKELRDFVARLEVKAQSWKQLLDEKEVELKKLRAKLKKASNSSSESENSSNSSVSKREPGEEEDSMKESTKMLHAIETRDRLIERLELKIKTMAEEMLKSTKVMNKLSNEREEEKDPAKPRACCKFIEDSLRAANERCQELSEMLERSEEDNAIKAKQAMQALTALDAYQRGEDGLVKALRKCASLEQKLLSRDKQIKALIMELNSMHEICYENGVLRKRLNIPDDVVISAKNLAAKERNKDKIIERLTLKLRTSEEMRLKLKLEKTELRQQLLKFQKLTQHGDKPIEPISIELKVPSEVGEVEDSMRLRVTENSNQALADVQTRCQELTDENETLRLGMHDILERLREYDEFSDHITIDSSMLQRLIKALKVRSLPNTPERIQSGVQHLKCREELLRDYLKHTLPLSLGEEIDPDLSSIESLRDDSKAPKEITPPSLPNIDTSTRPTTPNKNLSQASIPVINDCEDTAETRELQLQLSELQGYRKHYEELSLHLKTSGSDMQQRCAEMVEQVKSLEQELLKQRSSYAYMREDFDKTLTEFKQSKLRHIEELADLKRSLGKQQQHAEVLDTELGQLKRGCKCTEEERQALEKTNGVLSAQLAYTVERILSGALSEKLRLPDICPEYGIIQENLQLDFVTAQEYEQQIAELKMTGTKQEELRRKTTQLEGLLEIAQSQIQSQQKLLNEITDNHINLRHQVADLQSSTEEKFLMAKLQRDLDTAKSEMEAVRSERDELKEKTDSLQIELNVRLQTIAQAHEDFQNERRNKDIKIKFLQKSLFSLKEKYAKFTPLIFLTNFVFAYTKFVKKSAQLSESTLNDSISQKIEDLVVTRVQEINSPPEESQNLIKLIKTETQYKLLEENFTYLQKHCTALEEELKDHRIRSANESEHWQTIEALFPPAKHVDKQHPVRDVGTNTDTPVPAERRVTPSREPTAQLVDKSVSPITSPVKKTHVERLAKGTQTQREHELPDSVPADSERKHPAESEKEQPAVRARKQTNEALVQTCAESSKNQGIQTEVTIPPDEPHAQEQYGNQALQEALQRVNTQAQNLVICQQELTTAQNRIVELQEMLETAKSETQHSSLTLQQRPAVEMEMNHQTGIIEKTIISFHTLLSEKDKSIGKYQDMLQSERQQAHQETSKLHADIEGLKSTVTNLNFNIKTKDMEILELKHKLESVSVRRNSNEKLDLACVAMGAGVSGEDNVDNSLNELTDEKIEEMFQQGATVSPIIETSTEKQDTESLKELSTLQRQIAKFKDQVGYLANTLKVKEEEVVLLKEKINLYHEREKSIDNNNNPEIEQLRVLLEEKDKHINDLMETLNNFHDDQQRFIKDSSNYSADKISKLAADLTRTEATNKIYHTQVEALRRQLTSLSQREKQARDLNQSLRNQLIKRPVVSIKTELNARVKTENLQKRIQQLELDLEEARAHIQRQQIIIDAKRAKSASEVGLWEKQKRWQQNAEKFKAKLEETECTLEKTRALLQTARNTIARLEKDKQVLEVKLARAAHGHVHSVKCCRTPSCPNLQHGGTKYTPSESPETYTGASSECSSPVHSAPSCGRVAAKSSYVTAAAHTDHHDLIDALKARIELQQRKILSMEMEGKGSNALTAEMEKLQERFSAIEAHNIRLEAKNLQLQLDNDLLRQGDGTERLQKRIKHLEDYIIALKEEIAQVEARRELCKCSSLKISAQSSQPAEQTILSLRNIVEKLRAENRYLKDARRPCETRNNNEMSAEVNRLKKLYAESMEKVTALQRELKMKCPHCVNHSKADPPSNDELIFIKEQLVKKTELLQKAKILLTRAAAKEKVLKEQLSLWKRKCSELQNVPVIDEISE